MANESGCLLCGKGGRHVPLSRRDILRIARRFNAGKHPAWHTSPEGTAEAWGMGLDLPAAALRSTAQVGPGRPFGTRDFFASNPALKRWAILACPFGTEKNGKSARTFSVIRISGFFRHSEFVIRISPDPVHSRVIVSSRFNSTRATVVQ